jgi:glycosyltransferase involved in cell wall biosynthesis
MTNKEWPSIAFAWSGLPEYAARCIRAFISTYPGVVYVIGTRPVVPLTSVEKTLGSSVCWVSPSNRNLSWDDLGLPMPQIFIQGGYSVAAFKALGKAVKRKKGYIICMSDAAWRQKLRQRFIDPIRHRLLIGPNFNGWLVPGKSGRHYATQMGYSSSVVWDGMYGADPNLFFSDRALSARDKIFAFVGRIEHIKNILALTKAFQTFSESNPDWWLYVYGEGQLSKLIPAHPRIKRFGFLQPADLSVELRKVRCLCLPSLKEPWGLVVHEATLSGCALALSHEVGAADDLAGEKNALIFNPIDENAILRALQSVADWDDDRWSAAHQESLQLSKKFNPDRFSEAINSIIREYLQQK